MLIHGSFSFLGNLEGGDRPLYLDILQPLTNRQVCQLGDWQDYNHVPKLLWKILYD